MRLPGELEWLFCEVDFSTLDSVLHGDLIVPRVLEKGRLEDVAWLVRTYGDAAIRRFLREVGHPELSPRTLAFWRAYFACEEEPWRQRPAFRRSSAAPWLY